VCKFFRRGRSYLEKEVTGNTSGLGDNERDELFGVEVDTVVSKARVNDLKVAQPDAGSVVIPHAGKSAEVGSGGGGELRKGEVGLEGDWGGGRTEKEERREAKMNDGNSKSQTPSTGKGTHLASLNQPIANRSSPKR